jgi:hypothetical protein
MNEHDLRESFRIQASLRNTRYVGLDAMENISPRQEVSAEARFDSIKSLVRPSRRHEETHAMNLIMAGHYSLLTFWRANAQLARRVTEIPVLPYRETAQDIRHFEELLHRSSKYYPLRDGKSLRDWNDVLFHLSGGCVGLLRKLLSDAIAEMRVRDDAHLTLDHVIDAAPPKAKLAEVMRDLDGFWPFTETSASADLVERARAREYGLPEPSPASRRTSRVGRKVGPRDTVGAKK